jgi:hypothetical protein
MNEQLPRVRFTPKQRLFIEAYWSAPRDRSQGES